MIKNTILVLLMIFLIINMIGCNKTLNPSTSPKEKAGLTKMTT